LAKALELHQRVPVIDIHSHFLINGHFLHKRFDKRHRPARFWNPLRNHLDLPRLQEAMVSCSGFAVYVPIAPFRFSAWKSCLRILDTLDRIATTNSPAVVKVDSAQGIRQAKMLGKFAILAALEGGHVLELESERLKVLQSRGVRLLTLTHFMANQLADSCWGPQIHGGLSDFGREVISCCDRLGIVVDLTHCSSKAFYQALEIAAHPPVVSHAALSLDRSMKRGLTQDQIRALAAKGGALGLNLCRGFLAPHSFFKGMEVVAEAYAQVAQLVGSKHLMLGTDLDGYTLLPVGMRDVTGLPWITAHLIKRGFSDEELTALLGGNALRMFEVWEDALRPGSTV
jgi:membrane dipeptidase